MTAPDLPPELVQVLTRQDGVVGRRQALASGLAPHDVKRLLRRREWSTVHLGVYVDHTGTPNRQQRAWVAVLALGPAALWGASALGDDGDRPIHVAIDRNRSRPPAPPAGVRLWQVARLEESVLWHHSPPRQRYEPAVLHAALHAPDRLAAVAVLAGACGSRRTTAARLLATLDATPRARDRAWVAGVLRDVAEGTCSALEHGFVTEVERPHGLRSVKQHVSSGAAGVVYRDAMLDEGAYVELDGRVWHSSTRQRDRDLRRDLAAAGDGAATVRLGWGQVFGRPCETAYHLVRFLRARGVREQAQGCGPGCPVADLARDAS